MELWKQHATGGTMQPLPDDQVHVTVRQDDFEVSATVTRWAQNQAAVCADAHLHSQLVNALLIVFSCPCAREAFLHGGQWLGDVCVLMKYRV